MKQSPKPEGTASSNPSEPAAPGTTSEPPASVDLPADAAEPAEVSFAADERPGIDVLAPWDPNCEAPEACPYAIQGSGEVGVAVARVRAYRAAPETQLGSVRWEVDGPQIASDGIPGDAAEWEVTRALQFPYDPNEPMHHVRIWVFNRWDSGRIHRNRYVIYRDHTPPAFQIIAPVNEARLPIGRVSVSGWAEDRQSGVAAIEWSLDDGPYQPVSMTPGPRVDWHFEFDLPPGPHTVALRFRDRKSNVTPRTAGAVIALTGAGSFKPRDVNDLVGLRAYLEDLLWYAARHIRAGAAPLQNDDLARLFHQPFEKLAEGGDEIQVRIANQPVNQLRAALEVVREYRRRRGALPALELRAHWRFDEGQGEQAEDATGHGHLAALRGPQWAAGRAGSTLSFDGVDDYVSVGAPQQLVMTGAVSLCAWIHPHGPGTKDVGGAIVAKEYEYVVARFPDGSLQWAFANSQPGWTWTNTGYQAPQNQWTHLAVVYDHGRVTTYANGRAVHTYQGAGEIGSVQPGVHDLRLGGRLAATQHFHGRLDDVRVFAGPLAGDDVAALAHMRTAIAPAAPAVTEAGYCLAAHHALLNQIGTSFDEIRLARGADSALRSALAARLGLTLDPGFDPLEALLLHAPGEVDLERLFGLAATTRDPADAAPEPLLLTWRREHLERLWREQDEADFSQPEAPAPIIDPDLIGPGDLRLAEAGNPAFDLWQARAAWLAATFAALQTRRRGQPEAMPAFETLVSEFLGQPVAQLLALDAQQKAGTDIAAALKALHLTQAAFTRLLRVRALIVNQAVNEADWDDVFHILVQAKKLQAYSAWRAEEMQHPVALTPDWFKAGDAGPSLPPWRATWLARFDWLDRLRSRADQRQALEDALRAAVSKVEEQTLPLLRDAVVAELAQRLGVSVSDAADWLTDHLQVDVKTNGSQRTTRLIQAIQTVQGVLFSLRAVRFGPGHPAAAWKLSVDDDHFDDEWEWIGAYSTWRAAMFVFFFPENVLLPSLREPYDAARPADPLRRTKAFEALAAELRRRPRLTPAEARELAGSYLESLLKDLGATLKPDSLRAAIANSRPAAGDSPAYLTDQHTDEALRKVQQACREAFAHFGNKPPSYVQEIFYGAPLQLALQLQKSGSYLAALDWFQRVYAYSLPPAERKIYRGLEIEDNLAPVLSRSDHWLRGELNPHGLAASRAPFNAHTRYTLLSLARCLMDFADSEFTRDTGEALARALTLYLTARGLLLLPEFDPPVAVSPEATVFPNPLLDILRLRVEIQLDKLRGGRNIAGLRRQVELPVSLPPGPNDLPVIGPGGQLIIPGAPPALRPTPYRFGVLMERSQQLVTIAQQIEAAYLAALEKADAEHYNLLRASHDLQLAQAGEELQARRVQEANAGVELARRQQQRARVMSERYSALSRMELNQYENQMVQFYREAISDTQAAGAASANAALLQGMAAFYSSIAAAASSFMTIGAGPFSATVPNMAAMAAHSAAAGLSRAAGTSAATAAILSANAQIAQTQAAIAGVYASHEWRKREWEVQAAIAEQEVAIGEAQVNAAQAHVGVAQQERRIAQAQVAQAQAVADFLGRKFTNAELYEWMSDVLGEVYAYFLQQATALAQLAQNQLAFERQDRPRNFIRADYWQTTAAEAALTADQKAPDRRGLTGSARLLRDLHELDQYAFETDRRKLNLAQTFSLARLAPLEFEQFRETGRLPFALPMALFDREFPGHYLRLIKRVRASVVALVPPHHGIRATLTASGISRVVTGGEVFQEVVIRRDPELVALTAPINATGVFELDAQTEMLLPFEAMGVDTAWQFEMPRAANPFDFRAIADVLITIEYTALHSFDYRAQVLKTLDPRISGQRSFSFRFQFADAWYDLHNPEQSATPMTVRFQTRREDFPPNVEGLKIEHVLLFFSRAEGEGFEVEVRRLQFANTGAGATTMDGVISTRRGNAPGWLGLIGKAPVGEWELSLADHPQTRGWFKDEKIQDILLVITYGGRAPAWPA